ncbi:hypothetical protein SDC9_107128 [bioreactor metagenome]|uniref:ATPase AAA-type core domain-containing protein n=1 Tax=bioreactor metagenome TaxID=1076179 RepID=A0A645B4E3_9ZZZZ
MKGLEFIRFIAEINQIPSMDKAYELLKYFELDPKGSIKKMSKGMKQKVALVCAFMQDRQVIILDEPSSGLDPLMQQKFIELVLAEKQRGKTIFMSSHIFEEVEKCCDHTAIIKDGCLVAVEEIAALKNSRRKIYDIEMASAAQALAFSKDYPDIEKIADKLVSVVIVGSTAPLIKALGRYEVTALDVRTQSLEELFMHFYGGKD